MNPQQTKHFEQLIQKAIANNPTAWGYRPCFVSVPEIEDPLEAIALQKRYYSLVKKVETFEEVDEIVGKLSRRGDELIIVKCIDGNLIWAFEPDAALVESGKEASDRLLASIGYLILETRRQYRTCHISVPDLDERMAAVLVNEQYYGLFKVLSSREEAITIADRLLQKSEPLVLTRLGKGYGVWVWEPDAQPGRKIRKR